MKLFSNDTDFALCMGYRDDMHILYIQFVDCF